MVLCTLCMIWLLLSSPTPSAHNFNNKYREHFTSHFSQLTTPRLLCPVNPTDSLPLEAPAQKFSPGSSGGHFILFFQISFTRFLQTFNEFFTICSNYQFIRLLINCLFPGKTLSFLRARGHACFLIAIFPEPNNVSTRLGSMNMY